MERTINGKKPSDIIKEIEDDFPSELMDKDQSGHPYFPAYAYQNRLNDIVGIFNYDFEVESHKIVELREKYYVTTMGTLTIKYDDGTPALMRRAEGGTDVIMLKDTGKPKDLTDNIKRAATDAFKACCRKLGMAEKQLQNLKKKNNNGNNGYANAGNQQGNQQGNKNTRITQLPEEEYCVVVTGAFEGLNGKGYKAPAKDVRTNETVSLVFWADAIQKVEEKMPMADFCKSYVNKRVSVIAQKSTYNSKSGPEITLTVRGFSQPAQQKTA